MAMTDGDSESHLLIPDSGAVTQRSGGSGRASESESANDDSESTGRQAIIHGGEGWGKEMHGHQLTQTLMT